MFEMPLLRRRRVGVALLSLDGWAVGVGGVLFRGLLRNGAVCAGPFVLRRQLPGVFDPERATRAYRSPESKTPVEAPIRGCEHSVTKPQALCYLRPCHLLIRSLSCILDPSTHDSYELLTRGPAFRRRRSAQEKNIDRFPCGSSSTSIFLGSV